MNPSVVLCTMDLIHAVSLSLLGSVVAVCAMRWVIACVTACVIMVDCVLNCSRSASSAMSDHALPSPPCDEACAMFSAVCCDTVRCRRVEKPAAAVAAVVFAVSVSLVVPVVLMSPVSPVSPALPVSLMTLTYAMTCWESSNCSACSVVETSVRSMSRVVASVFVSSAWSASSCCASSCWAPLIALMNSSAPGEFLHASSRTTATVAGVIVVCSAILPNTPCTSVATMQGNAMSQNTADGLRSVHLSSMRSVERNAIHEAPREPAARGEPAV